MKDTDKNKHTKISKISDFWQNMHSTLWFWLSVSSFQTLLLVKVLLTD